MQKSHLIVTLFLLLTLGSCRTATEVTASWRDTDRPTQQYNSIFLAAIVDDLSLRQNLEGEFANRLAGRNVNTTKSIDTFKPTFFDEGQPEREQLVEIIRETECESILTITLIDVDEEERFVPGGAGGRMYHPGGTFRHYGSFPGYFDHWYGTAWNQGYYQTDRNYFIETNLYDAASLELVWSAQSKTLNPSTDARFAREYVDAIKAQLREEGLVQ
ncbi:hypothetical protein KI659_13935 [Litoribacter alkaliphilus]|uniref:DUF4136 domain-containing protein n=1 Tax=Litoribacter ruber TaxID=702568 RepID=A0AAP2CKW0_9BACT|nr:hypothetical protein [Litoribacter alkaliphilus]MBS9525116.1 hypothetical protein [Litoribacter alkaliphilus]